MSNILVTGGAGFIGSHLVDELVALSHTVTILDNLSTGTCIKNKKAYFEYIDINNTDSLNHRLRGCRYDYIFHLAAQVNLRKSIQDPFEDAYTNVLGTINILNIAKISDAKKFIFVSTGGAMYDEKSEMPWNETSTIKPQSPYALSKYCAEQYVNLLCPCPYAIMRLSNVYGPRQNAKGEAGVVAIFIDNILKNKPLTIFGDGTQTRDYIYVKDVVDALIKIMPAYSARGILNVSTGIETDVNKIASLVLTMMNTKGSIVNKHKIHGEMLRSVLSSEKLMRLGWKANTELEYGIKQTVSWFNQNNA